MSVDRRSAPPRLLLLLLPTVVVLAVAAGAFVTALSRRPPPRAVLVSGSEAGADWTEVQRLSVDVDGVRGLACLGDGTIVVGGEGEIAFLGSVVDTVRVPAPVRCLAVGADVLYAGAIDCVMVLDHAGRLLTVWSSLGEGAAITGIAWSGERVYVADAGQKAVFVYREGGRLVGIIRGFEYQGDFQELVVPSPYLGVAPAPGGVWVANPGTRMVYGVDAGGMSWTRWGGMELFSGCCNPAYLAAMPGNQVVSVEKGTWLIRVHDETGHVLGVVARGRTVSGVASDSQGRILCVDPDAGVVRVYERTRSL